MFKNLLSFFLVALVAVQASPRSFVDLPEEEIETFVNVGDIIEQIIEEIEKLLGTTNVEEIVKKILEWIENIFGQTDKNPMECIKEQKPMIKEIAETMKSGVKACVADAKDKLERLKESAEEIRNKAHQLLKDSREEMKECAAMPNGKDKWDCFKNAGIKLRDGMKEIKSEAMELREKAKQIEEEARDCVENVKVEVRAKCRAVLDEIKKCIHSFTFELF